MSRFNGKTFVRKKAVKKGSRNSAKNSSSNVLAPVKPGPKRSKIRKVPSKGIYDDAIEALLKREEELASSREYVDRDRAISFNVCANYLKVLQNPSKKERF